MILHSVWSAKERQKRNKARRQGFFCMRKVLQYVNDILLRKGMKNGAAYDVTWRWTGFCVSWREKGQSSECLGLMPQFCKTKKGNASSTGHVVFLMTENFCFCHARNISTLLKLIWIINAGCCSEMPNIFLQCRGCLVFVFLWRLLLKLSAIKERNKVFRAFSPS